MSFEAAITQLIEIVSDTTPAPSRLGLGQAFRHNPTHNPEAAARSFHFVLASGDTPGPLTTQTRRHSASIALVVLYPEADDMHALTLAMGADYELLVNSLLDVSLWNRPTSSLWEIVSGGASTLPFSVVSPEGARALVVNLTVIYTQ